MKTQILLAIPITTIFLSLSACQQTVNQNTTLQKINKLPNFNQNYHYKRVIINKRNEAWVAGSKSAIQNTLPANAHLQTIAYYSADKAIIRFRNGRFVGYATAKPIKEWSETTDFLVSWQQIAQGEMQTIERCIVDSPKNEINNCQSMQLMLIDKAPIDNNLIESPLSDKTNELLWIEEKPIDSETADKKQSLYYAIAKNSAKPIYGQLYLDNNVQVTWQDW